MQVKIEIDCTPAEARAFLGLPDISGLNATMVEEVDKRMKANMALLQPEELLKTWGALGGQAQEQFRKLMTAATDAALSGRNRP
jgi:hypothetical protein